MALRAISSPEMPPLPTTCRSRAPHEGAPSISDWGPICLLRVMEQKESLIWRLDDRVVCLAAENFFLDAKFVNSALIK